MYEALYRKYRPRTFDQVAGQEFITETLKNQVRTGRLSHAYLFIGTRGTGKTTCARILAKAVNCEHPVDGNPCNRCPSCLGIEDGSIMDVVELDAASNNGVDDVRMLRDEAIFSPTTVRKRVYIIDEVHMLSKPAFNALLKILEEPPQHLMFILATTELNKVLPTILSRCQRHSFRRLDSETIAQRLLYVAGQEGIRLEEDAARLLGRLADGGMRDGLSLLDQCAAAETVDTAAVLSAMGLAGSYRTFALAESVAAGDVSAALGQYESLWQDGKEPASLLGELAGFFRDVLLLRLAPSGGRDLVSGAYSQKDMASVTVPDGELLRLLNVLQKYQTAMAAASNPRLQGELCMVEMCAGPAETVQVTRTAPKSAPAKKSLPAERQDTPAQPEIPETADPALALEMSDELLTDFSTEPTAPEDPAQETHAAEQHDISSAGPALAEPEVPRPESAPAADPAFWERLLQAIEHQIPVGVYVVLSDPQLVSGEARGNELILQVKPGFETTLVTAPETINTIRQCASGLAGGGVTVRVEEKTAKPILNTDMLDKLGQFSNVTIR